MNEEQSFTPGDVVKIISGPFAKLTGKVRDVNNDKLSDESQLNDRLAAFVREAYAVGCQEDFD
jgi:transcription antitermination factor NusG